MPNGKGSVLDALSAWGHDNMFTNAGEYWAKDNLEFDKTNPGLVATVGRAVNPMTGFGSAMGSMHNAASEGNEVMMALAALGAIPAFGKTAQVVQRPVEGLVSAGAKSAPSVIKTVNGVISNTAAQLGSDAVINKLKQTK